MIKRAYISGFFDELEKLAEEKPKKVFRDALGRLVSRKATRAVARKAGPAGRVLGPATRLAQIKIREKRPPSMAKQLKKVEKNIEKNIEKNVGANPDELLKKVTQAGQMSWSWGASGPQRVAKRLAMEVPGVVAKLKEKKGYDQQAQFKAQMRQLISMMNKRVAGKPNIFGEGGTRRALTLNFPQTRAAAEFERMQALRNATP